MPEKVDLYGIKNCDTVKKARAWLDGQVLPYDFHDFKTEGVTRAQLQGWAEKVGWETLLNRAGTTFRKLPDEKKENLDEAKAFALMEETPSMIKRPVLVMKDGVIVGFKPELYENVFKGFLGA